MREKWKNFRRRHPARLTRGQKLVRNAVCVLLLLIIGYRLLGCPPLTAMHAFRQAERRELAGPSEVIARVPGEEVTVSGELLEQFGERDHFGNLHDWLAEDLEYTRDYILGEKDGTFYCFFWEIRDWNWRVGSRVRSLLSLQKKTGVTTVMPMHIYYSEGGLRAMVLWVHTELEEAVSASVEVREVRYSVQELYEQQYVAGRCSGEGSVYGEGAFVIAAYQCAEPETTTREAYEALNGQKEVRVVLKNAAGDVIYDEVLLV